MLIHDDVIKYKHFPRYWPFVLGIHRSPVNSPHKGQWRGAFMFSLICVWIDGWVNNREAGDLRRYCAHYDDIAMLINSLRALWYQISITFILLLREWKYGMWSEFHTCRNSCGVMIFTKLTPRLFIEVRANMIFKWNQLWNHKPFVKSDHFTYINFVASHWVPLPV